MGSLAHVCMAYAVCIIEVNGIFGVVIVSVFIDLNHKIFIHILRFSRISASPPT